jgi:hypothetical protein
VSVCALHVLAALLLEPGLLYARTCVCVRVCMNMKVCARRDCVL